MSWEQITNTRWRWTGPEDDDARHLLVHTGDGMELRELHGATVHVYRDAAERWDHSAPLAGAEHQATYINPGDWRLAPGWPDADVFDWLEFGGYLP